MRYNLAELQASACERAGHAVELQRFGTLLKFDVDALRKLTFDAEKRICRMTFLLAGEPEMNDWRRFKMDPADARMVRENFARSGVLPMLFDHGWSGRGTLGAGRMLELPDDTPNIDAICRLTPTAWREAIEEEAWFSRSAGFYGWVDKEEFIHPVALEEGSLTSLAAMANLGEIRTMSALEARYRQARTVSVSVPDLPAASPVTTSPSGEAGKEEGMKLSKETLSKLGLSEGATDEQIEAAVTRLSAAPAPVTPVDVQALVTGSMTAFVNGRLAEVETARQIDLSVQEGVDAGQLPGDDSPESVAERGRYSNLGAKLGVETLRSVIGALAVRFAPKDGRGIRFVRGREDTSGAASAPSQRELRHAADFVGANPSAYDADRFVVHNQVIEYMKRNKMTGLPGEYPRALHEVTRARTELREVPIG